MTFSQIVSSITEWLVTHTLTLSIIIGILVVGWSFAHFLSSRIRTRMARNPNADDTVAPAVAQFARYAVYITTITLVLLIAGVPLSLMLTALGAAGLAIAIGLRGVLSNISSGLMILALRPMSVGDYVEGPDFSGSVVEIELFNTILKSAKGQFIFVPNSKIWGVVITNYTRESNRRLDIDIEITYDAEIALARHTLLEISSHDDRILNEPEPVVLVTELNMRAVNIRLQVWTSISDYWGVRFELLEAAKLAFDANGIAIAHVEPILLRELQSQKVQ